jgi:hypothetical protein
MPVPQECSLCDRSFTELSDGEEVSYVAVEGGPTFAACPTCRPQLVAIWCRNTGVHPE